MLMPRCGEITIEYNPKAEDGFRLGLMSDFGIDTSEAEDILLDDILYINTDSQGGVIAGSNTRSVLLAVYRYLYENGCRGYIQASTANIVQCEKLSALNTAKWRTTGLEGSATKGLKVSSVCWKQSTFRRKSD